VVVVCSDIHVLEPTIISIVITRMQDLASEFSKIFRGWYPRTLTAGGGDPLLHPTPSPAFGRARGASAPVLGPKPWSPSTFQPWSRPCPWILQLRLCHNLNHRDDRVSVTVSGYARVTVLMITDVFVFVYLCILCVFVSYCIVVVLLWARLGGPDGIEV